jgi:hypothetical protein
MKASNSLIPVAGLPQELENERTAFQFSLSNYERFLRTLSNPRLANPEPNNNSVPGTGMTVVSIFGGARGWQTSAPDPELPL